MRAFGLGERGARLPGRVAGHPQAVERLDRHGALHGRLRPGRVVDADPARQRRQRDRQRRNLRAPRLVSATVGPDGELTSRTRETRQVVSEQTASQMQSIMREVVCSGTADSARVDGWSIAGKTRTAYKAQADGTYFNADGSPTTTTQLRRVLPGRRPQVTVLISIDEPKPASTPAPSRPPPCSACSCRRSSTSWPSCSRPVPPIAMETEPAMMATRTIPTIHELTRCCHRRCMPASRATRRSPCRRSVTTPARCSRRDVRLPARRPPRRALVRPRRGRRRRSSLLVDHHLRVADVGDVTQLIVDDTRLALGPDRRARSTAIPRRRSVSSGSPGRTARRRRACSSARSSAPPATRRVSSGRCRARSRRRRPPPAGPPRRAPRHGAAIGGDGGLVARPRPAPCRRHAIRPPSSPTWGSDHLDLHGTVEEYFRAKALLFQPGRAVVGVVNVDDAHGRKLATRRRSRSFRSASTMQPP